MVRSLSKTISGFARAGPLAGIAIPIVALLLCSLPARASNLQISELASLLVLPVITGGQPANLQSHYGDVVIDTQRASTLITVTNASAEEALLLIDVISGDLDQDVWNKNSYTCPLTGRETTTLVFSPAHPGASNLTAECGRLRKEFGLVVGVDTDGAEIRSTTATQNGFVVIAWASPYAPIGQNVVSLDALFGEALVVDPLGAAYSMPALSFQAGPEPNNGDRAYEFGTEYAALPGVVAGNFVAEGTANGVDAELILLTLDGRLGSAPPPLVSAVGSVFDDDESSRGFSYGFESFDVVPLSEISSGFFYDTVGSLDLASPTGHFELASRAVEGAGYHDVVWGDGDGNRNRGLHGWIVQHVDGVLLPGDVPVTGVAPIFSIGGASWALPLVQSTTALVPSSPADQPVLDLRF